MTVTHVIYHIPGRKVGCTKDIKGRKQLYLATERKIPDMRVLQTLHNKTNKEAGDIEWEWADKLGYKRGSHYASTGYVTLAHEKRVEAGRKSMSLRSPDQRFRISQKGGRKGGHVGGAITAKMWRSGQLAVTEKRRKLGALNGVKGGPKGSRIVNQLGLSGCQQRGKCPHCGIELSKMLLGRWHFDKCRRKTTP